MGTFKERIELHDLAVKLQEQADAARLGVRKSQESLDQSRFVALVWEVIEPVFLEFKSTLRDLGRDAAILNQLDHPSVSSYGVVLLDRYVRLGMGKTLQLVNPKKDITKIPGAKFYRVFCKEGQINVQEKVDGDDAPITTELPPDFLTQTFLENELDRFFRRAYPLTEPES